MAWMAEADGPAASARGGGVLPGGPACRREVRSSSDQQQALQSARGCEGSRSRCLVPICTSWSQAGKHWPTSPKLASTSSWAGRSGDIPPRRRGRSFSARSHRFARPCTTLAPAQLCYSACALGAVHTANVACALVNNGPNGMTAVVCRLRAFYHPQSMGHKRPTAGQMLLMLRVRKQTT